MGMARVYIKTFNNDGTYQDDFVDVTKYVADIGSSKLDADSLDFLLGAYTTSAVSVKVNNRSGQFSDVGTSESIFKYKRENSIIRITWSRDPEPPVCGFCISGQTFLSVEKTCFEGLLSDDSLSEQSSTEEVEFQVLGYETLFEQITVPTTVAIGDLPSSALYQILNQTLITDLLVVSPANINPGTNLALDNIDDLLNASGKDAIDALLADCNSVLYIENLTVYVVPRSPSTSVVKTFYGQASQAGIESLIDVQNITNGKPRLYNYFYWDTGDASAPSAAAQKDIVSIRKYGAQRKSISSSYYTDETKRNQILADLLAEFKDLKQEMEIVAMLDEDLVDISLLDRISIDYPTVFEPSPGFSLPVLGIAICGSSTTGPQGAVLPIGLWSLQVSASDQWKVLSKEIDVIKETVVFKVRKV